MDRLKALLLTTIGLFVFVSCATMPRSSSASPRLYENCPLRVTAASPAAGPVADNSSIVPDTSRQIIIISDLHMGIGKNPQSKAGKKEEEWKREEDFRWGPEFELFLLEIDRLGAGKTDLILNGDTFELWQSAENDCRYGDKNLGCTEKEVLKRIDRVISQHRPELEALGRFADSGDNRLIVVPGNHDAAIQFPEVGKTVLAAIHTKAGRVRIASEGFWMSADKRIYVEHGHQIGQEANCLRDWPKPFLVEGDLAHLQRPGGEQFVQEFFNQYEYKYPIIDNFSGELEGVGYGLAVEGIKGSVEGVGDLFRFVFTDLSWEQITQFLGEEGEGLNWDVTAIRKKEDARFLAESLSKDDPLREVALTALNDNTLKLKLGDFSDEEIVALCDKRAMLKKKEPDMIECPQKTLGASADKLLRSKNVRFGDHLENTYRLLELTYGVHQRFDIFIYGHTHGADPGFSPLKGNWKPKVVNSGAWQRIVNSDQLKNILAVRKLSSKEVLTNLSLEDLPACYSLIKVGYNRKGPVSSLRYWQKDKDKPHGWGLSETESCSFQPQKPEPTK